MMKARIRVPVGVFFLVVSMCLAASCASQKAAYVTASTEFNLVLESYLDMYDQQDEATQAYWKKEIDPKFRIADAALDAWAVSLKLGNFDDLSKRREFKKAKNELLEILFLIYQGGGSL
jgi:hypothetical protein